MKDTIVERYNKMAGRDADELACLRAQVEELTKERDYARNCESAIGRTLQGYQLDSEAIGAALDELRPGWEGDYADVIRQMAGEIAAVTQERDALAAYVAYLEPRLEAFDRGWVRFTDPAPILAARDQQQRREGADIVIRLAGIDEEYEDGNGEKLLPLIEKALNGGEVEL
jgi:hypothetical protein